MYLSLNIGDRNIEIGVEKQEYEDTHTWSEILDELVWPALRAYGYIIDYEFTDNILEAHRDYLETKKQTNKEPEIPFADWEKTEE